MRYGTTGTCILLASGVHAQAFELIVPGRAGYVLDAALTIFWVVAVTASFSILDHMDGLCAGVAATASFFFALVAFLNGQVVVSTLAAAVLGAAAGFLRWNFKPAKIFMGDGGAMFLGFLMATLGLKLRLSAGNHASALLAPLLILGVTIFDTTLVSISRARRGLLPFAAPGKDHAAHRLANLGLGQRGAVLVLYLLGALSGASAILVSYFPARAAVLFAAVVVTPIAYYVPYLLTAGAHTVADYVSKWIAFGDWPTGPAWFKGGHDDWTGNMVICLESKKRCVVMLANDVRAERIYPEVARMILGDTKMPWTWEYGWLASHSPRP